MDVFLTCTDPLRTAPLGIPPERRFDWRRNLSSQADLSPHRRVVVGDSGMLTFKHKSSRSVEEGLKALSGYHNTRFVMWAGAKASNWVDELRKIRQDPAWAQLMTFDPEYGIMRFPEDVEIQIYDGGNQLLEGTKDLKKQFKDLPGLRHEPTKNAYYNLFSELLGSISQNIWTRLLRSS